MKSLELLNSQSTLDNSYISLDYCVVQILRHFAPLAEWLISMKTRPNAVHGGLIYRELLLKTQLRAEMWTRYIPNVLQHYRVVLWPCRHLSFRGDHILYLKNHPHSLTAPNIHTIPFLGCRTPTLCINLWSRSSFWEIFSYSSMYYISFVKFLDMRK